MRSSLTARSFACIRFVIVTRLSLKRPVFVFAHACVKPRKLERLRPTEPAPYSVHGGVPPELDQARLLGVQLQGELRESFAQIAQEPLRVIPMLKAHHEVVGETHDDHIAVRVPASPLVGPQIEDVMQVDVRKQR